MEMNLSGVIISISLDSTLDDGKESFDLFDHVEEEKWSDSEVMMKVKDLD